MVYSPVETTELTSGTQKAAPTVVQKDVPQAGQTAVHLAAMTVEKRVVTMGTWLVVELAVPMASTKAGTTESTTADWMVDL